LSCHASGIISIMAWASEYPPIKSSSSALSKVEESDGLSPISGHSFSRSSPSTVEFMECRRAFIQLMLPRTVLISPLWHRNRNGCASRHDGNVLVENRW